MLEAEMTANGILYFESIGEYKIIKQEVPFLSRCIDVVLINRHDELISIEFKINDWKHAIEQALNHKLGADKAYICLPKRRVTEHLSKAISNANIGLLFYDETTRKIDISIPAPTQKNIPVFKEMLLCNVMKI